jgi:glycosyltransferase involved in cell wall biosynthesis
VQYIHQPQFNRRRLDGRTAGRLDPLWSHLAGPEPGGIDDSTTLVANSEWTAERVEAIYDTRPEVVYPPVEPIECEESWKDREPGIVLLGRLAPDKRILEAISLVDAVRERGPDVHLHIVGSAPRAYRRYVARVAWAAQDRPYVTLDRNASRERVEGLLCSHRYGLNMKEGEHFGMAVAEYVSAGMDAFVPASGGQQEIVQDERTFTTLDEAVDLVTEAIRLSDPPARSRDRFHPDRFAASIRQHVNQTID